MLKPSRNVQINNRCKIVDLRHSIVSVALEFASFTQTCIERVLSREASHTTLEGHCFAMRNTGNLVSRAKSERGPSDCGKRNYGERKSLLRISKTRSLVLFYCCDDR